MKDDNASPRHKSAARREKLFVLAAAAALAVSVGLAFYFAAPF